MTRATTRRALVAIAATLAAAALLAEAGGDEVDLKALAADVQAERDHVSAPELARWIRDGKPGLMVLDVRDSAAFEASHVPGARRVDLDALMRMEPPRDATIVLYSEGGTHAAQGWMLLRARGWRRVYFLREGLYEWEARVLEPRLAVDATPAERAAFDAIAPLTRYFGGHPHPTVPRAEVPEGYWTENEDDPDPPAAQRRSC